MKYLYYLIIVISFTISPLMTDASERFSLEMEGGAAIVGSNNIQIPNPAGTLLSLTDALDVQEKAYFRLRLNYRFAKRHQLSLLYAPLSIKANGKSRQAIFFQNTLFEAGSSLSALYRFNSYRLTYRYQLVNKEKLKLWAGFTAKIRDAEVALETPEKKDNLTNVGFVPLLNLLIDWSWSKKSGLIFEADAMAAPGGQGRAEDVALSFYFKLDKKHLLKAGYRFVEGGSDVEKVYNFAFINYFFAAYQFYF